VAGTFAATGSLDALLLFVLLAVAAVAGDTVNYSVGRFVGPRAFKENVRYLKKEYVDRAELFFEKHGGKAIVIARFAPIIRTFVPFVAGIGRMRYRRFVAFNVAGGVSWIALLVGAGYLFGNVELVRANFTIFIYAIVAVSLLPAVYEVAVAGRRHRAKG
jgi:membrane-associated protein